MTHKDIRVLRQELIKTRRAASHGTNNKKVWPHAFSSREKISYG
jgi:hypothetical protein